MKIDWQEFDDGGMDEEAMRRAKEELNRSASAQSELKGLEAFRSAVRSAGLAQPTPEHRLNQMLRAVCGRKVVPFWQKGLSLAAAAAACVALALFLTNQFADQSGAVQPATAFATSGDYERDYASVSKNSRIHVPHLQLAGIAEYKGVHSCRANVSFKLAYQGQEYTLTITPKEQMSPTDKVVKAEGVELVQSGDSFCWTCPASTYRLEGGDAPQRAKLAAALTKQTGYVRPSGPA